MKTHLGRIISLFEVRPREVRAVGLGGSKQTKGNSLYTDDSEVDRRSNGSNVLMRKVYLIILYFPNPVRW